MVFARKISINLLVQKLLMKYGEILTLGILVTYSIHNPVPITGFSFNLVLLLIAFQNSVFLEIMV